MSACSSAVRIEEAAHAAVALFCTPRRFPRPAWEEELRAGSVAGRRGGLATFEWGASGPLVLLLHGWEGRATQLGAFAAPLVAGGFRVVGVDGPAHGESAGETTNVREFSDALRRAFASDDPIHGVIAHSFGAAVIADAISRGLPAGRLALVAPVSRLTGGIRRFAAAAGLAPEAARRFEEILAEQVGATPGELEVAPRIGALGKPVVVFHDRADEEVPFADGEAIAVASRGEIVDVAGAGHRRILREPAVVSGAARFLAV